jgi:hypothetical protein
MVGVVPDDTEGEDDAVGVVAVVVEALGDTDTEERGLAFGLA